MVGVRHVVREGPAARREGERPPGPLRGGDELGVGGRAAVAAVVAGVGGRVVAAGALARGVRVAQGGVRAGARPCRLGAGRGGDEREARQARHEDGQDLMGCTTHVRPRPRGARPPGPRSRTGRRGATRVTLGVEGGVVGRARPSGPPEVPRATNLARRAPIAQGIEQRFPKPRVAGSNPAGGAPDRRRRPADTSVRPRRRGLTNKSNDGAIHLETALRTRVDQAQERSRGRSRPTGSAALQPSGRGSE